MAEEFKFNGITFNWKKATLRYYAESKKLMKKYSNYEEEETREQRAALIKIEGVNELLKENDAKKILEMADNSGTDYLSLFTQMLENIKRCKEIFVLENLQEILEVCLNPEEEIKKINYLSDDEEYILELIEFGNQVFDFFFKRQKNSTKELKKSSNTSSDTTSLIPQT